MATQTTPQQAIKELMAKSGIPYKQIDVYGSQIMVTAWSESAARRWARLIQQFATFRRIVKSVDYNKVNEGTNLCPTVHDVWLIAGRIE